MKDKTPPSTVSLGFGITQKVKAYKPADDQPSAEPERKARLLVVDKDPESRRFLHSRLTIANYVVDAVEDAQSALDACVRSRPNLVITDLHLQDMDGLALLKELKSRWPSLVVIIVTSHATIAQAVDATQSGAFGFLVKPVEKSELLGQVERAVSTSTFTLVEGDWRSAIVSRSQLMEDRLDLANRAAASDTCVLLTGENGTGKELLARAIHAASKRRDSPFVTVGCRDRSATDLEAQLFGTEASAGAFVTAEGGTLLIDEIGELPAHLQGRLTTALIKKPNLRLITTTSKDLKLRVADGSFRRDLLYQINILPIEIPPLGRRREDIPLLVSHFLEQAKEEGGAKKIYSPEAIELLATTDWPGNVRQLFDLVKQNVALSHGKVMTKDFVQRSLGKEASTLPTYDQARENFTVAYLKNNLQTTAGNVMQSARLAKRNRTDFYKLLARYRLQPDDFKSQDAAAAKGDDSQA